MEYETTLKFSPCGSVQFQIFPSRLNVKVLLVWSLNLDLDLLEYCPTTLTQASFNNNSLKVVRNSLKQIQLLEYLRKKLA